MGIPGLGYLIRRIREALGESESIAEKVHRGFSWLRRRRWIGTVSFFVVYSGLFTFVRAAALEHAWIKSLENPSQWAVIVVLAMLVLGAALLIIQIPLWIEKYHELHRKQALDLLSQLISAATKNSKKEEITLTDDASCDRVCRIILDALNAPSPRIIIISCNLFYFYADWMLDIASGSVDADTYKLIARLAAHAPKLRAALNDTKSEVDIVIPDLNNDEVLQRYSIRIKSRIAPQVQKALIRFSQQILVDIERSRRGGRKLRIHRSPSLIGRRVILSEKLCLTQEFPPEKLAIHSPAWILIPEAADVASEFALIKLALEAVCEIV